MKFLSIACIAAITYYGFVEKGPHTHGRIGVLYNPVNHEIVEVYKDSPAALEGIKRKDVVKYVDSSDIAGPAYTYVSLTIQRETEVLYFEILRVPDKLIDVRHPLPHEKTK